MYVRWLEDFLFDRTHLPGARAGCLAGVSDPESHQQERFSRLGRDAPYPVALAVIRAGWAANQRVAAVLFAGVRPLGKAQY